jgi:hypothetical protein
MIVRVNIAEATQTLYCHSRRLRPGDVAGCEENATNQMQDCVDKVGVQMMPRH